MVTESLSSDLHNPAQAETRTARELLELTAEYMDARNGVHEVIGDSRSMDDIADDYGAALKAFLADKG